MNLDALLNPKNIALIGANSKQNSVGFYLAQNLLKANVNCFFVNPFHTDLFSRASYPNVKDIPGDIDLAIIAIPAKSAAKVLEECGQKQVKAAIIVSAGYGESGEEGKKLENQIKEIAEKYDITLLGPNCLGIINTQLNLNASFAATSPQKGNVGFISQSGALISSIIDCAGTNNLGFSKIVSTGNELTTSATDFLKYFYEDKDTMVIALYTEGLKKGREFFELAKKITKTKPIIAIKAGRGKAGKKAATTHTGAITGDWQVYQAMFKQAGVICANSLEEFLDTAKLISYREKIQDGIGIVTNGGGIGVLASDYCEEENLKMPALEEGIIEAISAAQDTHPAWSKANPLDIVGDATPRRYEVAINSALEQKDINTLLVIVTPQAMTDLVSIAKVVVEAQKKYPQKDIVGCFLGPEISKQGAKILDENGVPNFPEVYRALKSIKNTIQ